MTLLVTADPSTAENQRTAYNSQAAMDLLQAPRTAVALRAAASQRDAFSRYSCGSARCCSTVLTAMIWHIAAQYLRVAGRSLALRRSDTEHSSRSAFLDGTSYTLQCRSALRSISTELSQCVLQ